MSTTESSNCDMEDKAFVQWVAQNVDHNQVTFTGNGIFHLMGIISVRTLQIIQDILCNAQQRGEKLVILLKKGNTKCAIPWKKP